MDAELAAANDEISTKGKCIIMYVRMPLPYLFCVDLNIEDDEGDDPNSHNGDKPNSVNNESQTEVSESGDGEGEGRRLHRKCKVGARSRGSAREVDDEGEVIVTQRNLEGKVAVVHVQPSLSNGAL